MPAPRLLRTFLLSALAFIAAPAAATTLVISVPEQRLYLFDDAGEKTASYPVSTSAHGLGDTRGSYNTPLGKLQIAAKIGHGAPAGAVFKAGRRTGEVLPVNAPGRDPIVTRILHLRGLEKQNAAAYGRCIYIHGTPDEKNIGKPVSYGCVRMRSRDIIELFDTVPNGATVEIVNQRVGKLFARTTWAVEPTRPASASPPATTTVPAQTVATSAPMRLAVASKTAPAARSDTTSTAPAPGGAMTVFEMPGMSFKFGPASRD